MESYEVMKLVSMKRQLRMAIKNKKRKEERRRLITGRVWEIIRRMCLKKAAEDENENNDQIKVKLKYRKHRKKK